MSRHPSKYALALVVAFLSLVLPSMTAGQALSTLANRNLEQFLTRGSGAPFGKSEDTAHVSGDTGMMPLGVRNDTHTTALSGTDGDYTPLGVDSTGKLGIRGTFAEDAGHSTGDLGLQILTVRQDTAAALAGTDADYQPLITDATGRLWTNTELPDAAALADGGSATPTTPTVGVVPLLMNATTVDRQRAVVNAQNSIGTGIAAAGVVGQFDDVGPGAITENQFGPLRMSSRREGYVQLRDAAGNERGANVNASNEVNVALASTSTVTVVGPAADGIAVSGNPVRIGGKDGGGLTQDILTDTAGRLEANIISGQTGIAGGTGVDAATVPRVSLATNVALPAGTNVIGALSANQSVNTAQINAVTPLMGNGVTGTGSQRVTIASDNTAFGVTLVPASTAAVANALTASAAAEGSNVLKASAGNLYSLTITTGATAGYLMIFNATSAPGDGAVTPAYCVQVPANMSSATEWSIPARFATGITAVFSSTGCFTKTVSATAAFFAQVN